MSIPRKHVYVHVPFCARRCSYCDFAIAVRRTVPVGEYLDALTTEISRARLDRDVQPIETLYFGGGTPSHLGADGVEQLLERMRAHFHWSATAEVTLEANPDDVTPDAARRWRDAGVTRVSLGAQSFDDRVLQWMHRTHSASQITRAVDVIRETGFRSWSFDLIFSLPASLERDWERDLSLALATRPPHLSLYGLTVEQGTPLGRWSERGEVIAADDVRYEHEFLTAHAAAESAGFDHYEVSNFAQPGHHAVHNRAYWQGAPYFGFGPSAHAFDGRNRSWNRHAYAAWLSALGSGEPAAAGSEPIGPDEAHLEAVYLGLRTSAGFQIRPAHRDVVEPWLAAGWATLEGDRLRLTALGWLRLDSLAAAIPRIEDDR